MKNVKYISASAGSGKTYTLTEELKNAISGIDGKKIEPEKIILTTFTKAAASEVLEKAKAKLYEEGLTSEAERLDQAEIGTIDSVCEAFVRKYWYVLGISPNPNVMTNDANDFFVNQSLLDLANDEESEFLADFADEFEINYSYNSSGKSGRNYDFWKYDLQEIIRFTQDYGIEDYEKSIEYSKSVVNKIKSTKKLNLDDKVRQNRFLDILRNFLIKTKEFNDKNETNAHDEIEANIEYITKQLDSDNEKTIAFYKSIRNFEKSLKSSKKWMDIEGRFEIKEELTDWFYSTEEVCAEIEKYIDTIFELAERWKTDYENYKKTHHLLDFTDMETKMFSLLDNEEVKNDIKSNYKYIFVDEAQDCSPLQVKIFAKLSDLVEKSIWVGDTKQAIYGFRGGDADLANAVVKIIKDKEKNHEVGFETFTLDTSYRSLENIVNATNTTFTKAFKDLPKNEIELKCDRKENKKETNGFIRYWVLTDENEGKRAEQIAKNIIRMIKNGEKPKDIAVLAKKNNDLDNVAAALKKYKVPVFRAKEKSDCDSDAKTSAVITLVTSLLTLLVDGTDEYAKAKIKHLTENGATLGEIIDEKLEKLVSILQRGSVTAVSTNANENLADKPAIYETQLSKELLEKKDFLIHKPIKNLVESMIIELDLYNKANQIISSDYEETSEILHAIIDSAQTYEENCTLLGKATTLNGFISYLNDNKVSVLGAKDGVQLFTFHSSKGLEWKTVILMSLDDDFLNEDKLIKREIFGVHRIYETAPSQENLFPMPVISVFPSIFSGNTNVVDEIKTSLENDEIYENAKSKIIEESKRLMYVAMTRPCDNLIFALNGKSKSPRKYFENLKFNTIQTLPQTPGEKCDLFNSGFLSEFEKNADKNDVPENYSYEKETFWPNELKSQKDKNLLPRNVNPSKLENEPSTSVSKTEELSSKINISGNTNKTELGTFLHNIFCVVQHKTNEEIAKIVANSGFAENIKNPDEIKSAWNDFTKYLEQKFGTAEITFQEYPFEFLMKTNQIAKGRMDFLWQTKNGFVIVDYKTFFGNEADVLSEQSESFAGKYQTQLDLYGKVLESAGEKVLAKILWYSCLGIVAELGDMKNE